MSRWEFNLKVYRISRRLNAYDAVPAGFEPLASVEEGVPVAELLVPASVAKQLVDVTKPPASASTPAAAAASPVAPASREESRSEFHVAMPSPEQWRRPSGPNQVEILERETLCKLVEQHNAGHGSADPADRRRMTQMLRKLVSKGPWRATAQPGAVDLHCLQRELRDELGHLPGLVDAVEASIARAQMSGQPFKNGPLLLVGQPGTGKSFAALRLAELLGLTSQLIDMAAQQTNSYLHGSDRHWGNATPGALFELLLLGSSANPLIVLDEIEKAPKRANYDPLAPLHSALEPVTSKDTKDPCIPAKFDASHVSYVATANSLRDIPLPLLSRFEIIHCAPPGPRESLQLARMVWLRVAERFGIEQGLPRSVLVHLAQLPPRRMTQALEKAVSRMRMAGRCHLNLSDLESPAAGSALH